MYLEKIKRLNDIIHHYDAVICDIWGVLHNGISLYQDAISALRGCHAQGKKVILLTNAPKSAEIMAQRFIKMGASEYFYDDIVTSGDTLNHYLFNHATYKKIFHWGLEGDRGIYNNLDFTEVQTPEEADFIVCTGLMDTEDEITVAEVKRLQAPAQKQVPFLCANPDRAVKVGDRHLICAGSLADIYIDLGGTVEFFGKPYMSVYHRCFHIISELDSTIPLPRILAIGDGLPTDIKGAQTMGLDVLLIKDGLHKDIFASSKAEEFTKLREICETYDVRPEYYMEMLR